ncbi:phage terminase large subunit family protein [Paenibacillus cremeus]|uniref:phage terminase large subunit family protein n=1 Tax=Paenibacillus cremeus TaxID=2163881 RepID=UPI0021BD4212|nr:phage terminase large subunit family protein [Paenibacillus cremeus]
MKEAIVARKQSIDAEIARKRNSLALLSELLDYNAEFETFETDRYWNAIVEKEAAGEKFIDIEDMYGYRSVSLIRNIRCPHCGKGYEVDLEDYMYDQSSDERENGMGPDIVYSFNSENSYECPECGIVIKIEGWIREYPVGAYDSEDIIVEEWED